MEQTVVATAFGLLNFSHIRFGLKNAGKICQRFIRNVLKVSFSYPYLKDILIASQSKNDEITEPQEQQTRILKY